MAVHQDAGAHVGRLVDVSFQERMPGQDADVVMVEIAHRYSGFEQSEQIFAILMEGNVEHRNGVAGLTLDAPQQCNIALDAGDERCLLRFDETKLLQSAQAIGVAVERVVASHIALTGPGYFEYALTAIRLAQTNTTMRRPVSNTTAVRITATANTMLTSPLLRWDPVAASTPIVIAAAGQLPKTSNRAIRQSTESRERWTIVPKVFVMPANARSVPTATAG